MSLSSKSVLVSIISGKVETHIKDLSGGDDIQASSMVLQSEGKILFGGWGIIDIDYHYAVLRYNVNGTLDSSFGTNASVG